MPPAWVNDGTRFDGTMNYPFTAATIAYAVGDRLDPTTRLDNADYSVAPAIDSSGYRDRIEWNLSWYNEAATAARISTCSIHTTPLGSSASRPVTWIRSSSPSCCS